MNHILFVFFVSLKLCMCWKFYPLCLISSAGVFIGRNYWNLIFVASVYIKRRRVRLNPELRRSVTTRLWRKVVRENG